MSEHRAEYRITTMCRVLEVSASGYYAWEQREPSSRERANGRLLERIRGIHEKSRSTYGAPRIIAELVEEGEIVGHNRVARLMRGAGLAGASRRKGCWTTRRAQDARPAPDLVERKFEADGPDRLWVADITYVPTWAGFLYLDRARRVVATRSRLDDGTRHYLAQSSRYVPTVASETVLQEYFSRAYLRISVRRLANSS
jgi:putative transposase